MLKRGDIYYANLSSVYPGETCVQYGNRPVVILGNRASLTHSPVANIVPLTTRLSKRLIPSHLSVDKTNLTEGKIKPSIILTEQIRTVDKTCLGDKIGHLNEKTLKMLNHTIRSQLAV